MWHNFKCLIFQRIIRNCSLPTRYVTWIPKNPSNENSAQVQVVFGVVRQQANTWANVDPDLRRIVASPGRNELTHRVQDKTTTSFRSFWKIIVLFSLPSLSLIVSIGSGNRVIMSFPILSDVHHVCHSFPHCLDTVCLYLPVGGTRRPVLHSPTCLHIATPVR